MRFFLKLFNIFAVYKNKYTLSIPLIYTDDKDKIYILPSPKRSV